MELEKAKKIQSDIWLEYSAAVRGGYWPKAKRLERAYIEAWNRIQKLETRAANRFDGK